MIQLLILFLSGGGYFLLGVKNKEIARFGHVILLFAQPFWFYTSAINGQWAIFCLTFICLGGAINGIRNNFGKLQFNFELWEKTESLKNKN